MQVQVRHNPSFGIARLTLDPNETVRAESGAMMAMSSSMQVASKAEGGVMKSLKRAALGGESFFITSYSAPAEGGFVDVAARLPGDVAVIDIDPAMGQFVSKGSWLASSGGVELDTQWGGFKNLFGGEGGFILRASGQGRIVLGCYGALEAWDLQPGQTVTVDTGHMVAYDETVQMTIRKATGGLVQSFKSGEGLVFDFTGPGKVLIQTRNPNEFLGWIGAAIGGGASGAGGAGGALGGLLGRN